MTKTIFPTSQAKRRVRVMIVDDTPQVLRDLRQLLELSGDVEVVGEARNGLEAVHLAADISPDVVVMDLEMPGMDGYEAVRQIKACQLVQRVVILSVHASPEEMDRARAAGADRFVTKGARYEILLNAILATDGSSDSFQPSKWSRRR